jgi:hypothetical protein
LKKLTILTLLSVLTNLCFSQSNFYKFGAGAGVGATAAFADLNDQTIAFSGYGAIDYYFTPFVTLGLEVQKGELAGGNIITETHHRQFINSYLSGAVSIKLQLGEFLTQYNRHNIFLDAIRGAYVGVGFGYIKNKISNVRYYGDNYYPGTEQSTEGIIPVHLGINFYLPNKWGYSRYVINLNLQHTMAIGEGLDGYNHDGKGQHNDMYTVASVGFKYNFGPMGLDRRR